MMIQLSIMKSMTKTKPRKKYACIHCGKEWDEWYLADLCFKDDMFRLEKEKRKLIPIEEYTKKQVENDTVQST